MMSIKIYLDNSEAVYFPGQTVVGRVQVTIDEAISTRGVIMKFKGQANTYWMPESANQCGDQCAYSGKEEYYNKKNYLFGDGINIITMKPGNYKSNFSFTLPENTPSSFESQIGQVRHQCIAKVIIPGGIDIKDKQPISVNNIYDLNTDADAIQSISRKEKKTFTLSSGCIFLSLVIDRTGFVPGEKLRVHCELDNDSDKIIEYVKMKLVKSVVYRDSRNGASTESKSITISKMRENNISGRGKHVIWSNTGVIIPPVPPSYLQHCNIINIVYKLKLIVCPSGFTSNMEMEQPIIIGTIPLQQNFHLYQMMVSNMTTLAMAANTPSVSSINASEATDLSASSLPNNESDDPPPAYNPQWLNEPGTPPVFPGFEQYPEMPPPSYSASQDSVPMEADQQSNNVPLGPFIPSYVTFNPHDSRPGTPISKKKTK